MERSLSERAGSLYAYSVEFQSRTPIKFLFVRTVLNVVDRRCICNHLEIRHGMKHIIAVDSVRLIQAVPETVEIVFPVALLGLTLAHHMQQHRWRC